MTIIGPYQIIKMIARGGMGEVFLAYDTSCGRQIALKKIREDLGENPHLQKRFLKEAYLTCQLTHPTIIPIYHIQPEGPQIYYTMPFVEGETLKHILKQARDAEKDSSNYPQGTIPALMRIFASICHGISYAHSKGIIHRDIKPENIIIGKYGEVLILDWGLAKFLNQTEEELPEIDNSPAVMSARSEITRLGKAVGTISYMAPELAMGKPANVLTDIYALGAILYQILALRNPFRRGKRIEEFRKTLHKEEWVDPVHHAPHRDIPQVLVSIARKCLSTDTMERYQTVEELINGINTYLEGRSDWLSFDELSVKNKSDWEFQENILIAGPTAITPFIAESKWVLMMISRSSYPGNVKLEAEIFLGENCFGIGILIGVPENSLRNHIHDGYCLWLASDKDPCTQLLRSNAAIMEASDIYLKRHQWQKIRLDKIDNTIHLYIGNRLQFSYTAHLPFPGTHLGLISLDADFEILPIKVSIGNLNITESCLAVPDSYLSRKYFDDALIEYHRIANSFPDRAEGREAIFKAGLTLIEQAKEKSKDMSYLDAALHEFEKLHRTPGAPLEYLGKSLVYCLLGDYEEEIKCFELAFRRYPNHPLLSLLKDQVVTRTHEIIISSQQRRMAYRFLFLTLHHIPYSSLDVHTRKLLTDLNKNWERLPFIEKLPLNESDCIHIHYGIQLAFWLSKPYMIEELLQEIITINPQPDIELKNALWCLIEMDNWDIFYNKLELINDTHPACADWMRQQIQAKESPLEELAQACGANPYIGLSFRDLRSLLYWMDQALDRHQPESVHLFIKSVEHCDLSFEYQLKLNTRLIWAYLLEHNWKAAEQIFSVYPLEMLNNQSTLLYFLYGCWLYGVGEKEIAAIHFEGLMSQAYPRTYTLAIHYLTGNLDPKWEHHAFDWEKKQLARQLDLYQRCTGDLPKTPID